MDKVKMCEQHSTAAQIGGQSSSRALHFAGATLSLLAPAVQYPSSGVDYGKIKG